MNTSQIASRILVSDFSNFIGRSPSMERLFDLILKVADTKSTVLITGESGTGKELAARAIHANSRRRDKPFVPINCGAIPANLLESELFGYVKGAFSGADRSKRGLFAEADGGTLFLDEISELPLDMQVKILRAIQEEEIRRLGESETLKIDLRVLAATNKDLREEVRAGRFREDLHYRLNVITLQMPPLRDRPEDIPVLAEHFLRESREKHGIGPKKLSPQALAALTRQTWSGNVRALKNVVEQAAVMSQGPVISLNDLPIGIERRPENGNGALVNIPEAWSDLKAAVRLVTEQTERILIRRVLARHGQNRTHAAETLGISRRALIGKIQEYELAAAPDDSSKYKQIP